MNEKILSGREMNVSDMSMKQVIEQILDKALLTRPERDVIFRPFKKVENVEFVKALGAQKIFLERQYPDASIGDGVITDFHIYCKANETIYLNVSPNVKVWYEGKCIYDGLNYSVDMGECIARDTAGGKKHLPISVKAGEKNPVRILCIKEENKEFSYEFLISVKRYPFMWANDYLFAARAVLPIDEYCEEDGVALSGLLKNVDVEDNNLGTTIIEYQSPELCVDNTSFDFGTLYDSGDVCYVYTEAKNTHTLKFVGTVDRIFINGTEGKYVTSDTDFMTISLKKGDKVLFRCSKAKEQWNLNLNTQDLQLSFLASKRKTGDRAICVGPFYGKQNHAPEFEWDFSKVFRNHRGEKLYWKFCDGSELRIYLDSVFFGQWFYALMVGFYGIRDAATIIKDVERQRLFCRNMSFLAKYFDYVEYDLEQHVMSAFMPRLSELNVLDNIGTMGMNLIDGYLDSNDNAILPLIERIRYQMEETVSRMEDGTFYREDTMWADDLYMSCPFLVRMGKLTGNTMFYKKAADQIQGYKKRLYMEEEALFSHIYFPREGVANKVPWGRGNGWVMWTLSELLMLGEDKIDLSAEKKLFQDMAHGIRKLQDESGLWHQVLNRTDEGSYLETSCTGMFMLAFTRGVKYGWLEEDFIPNIDKAWKGLLANSIDLEGNVYGVCMGSGCAMDAEYYFTIPTIMNDDHGTGVILAAASEYYSLIEK